MESRIRARLALLIFTILCGILAPSAHAQKLSLTPPMGWNDWAHYQCNFVGQDILDNAHALVKSGLAAKGYDTVTIDDCWMLTDRDAKGDLQVDPVRFPQGMKPIADAIHGLGLKFGIYEDAGYITCGKFAGSGSPKGGPSHFQQDAALFASWGVDYLKLDGCNVIVPDGSTKEETYRRIYQAQHNAILGSGRPMVFSQSAPAYFQDTPEWYDVLTWVPAYGQLWREGTDMSNFRIRPVQPRPGQTPRPQLPRFHAVLWNYAYNLPLGRFQKPGAWNDPDFIIAGDPGISAAEGRSQVALWAMMAAPLILSDDVTKLSPESIAMLGNQGIITVDQDPGGIPANLLRRTTATDLLIRPLRGGDYAVAVLNRSEASTHVDVHPADLGFSGAKCTLEATNLWTGAKSSTLAADIEMHDTAIWRIHPARSCGTATRTGAVVVINPKAKHDIDPYGRCLNSADQLGPCTGTPAESWTVTPQNQLKSGNSCLAAVDGKPVMQACSSGAAQKWTYKLVGNLTSNTGACLTGPLPTDDTPQPLSLQPCGHNQPDQIWSLPN